MVSYLDKQMSSAESSYAKRHGKEFREWLTTEASVLQRVSLSIKDAPAPLVDAPAPFLDVPVSNTSAGTVSSEQEQLPKEQDPEEDGQLPVTS